MCNKAVERYHFLTSGRAVTSGVWGLVARSLPVAVTSGGLGTRWEYCALIGQKKGSRDQTVTYLMLIRSRDLIPQYLYWLSRALIGYYPYEPCTLLIILFMYVFFNFKILWNIKLKLLTAKGKKYEITRWNDMWPAYRVYRVTSWNFERTPLDHSSIYTKKIVLIDVLHW